MTKRNQQINQIVKKIEAISEEDLMKVEALINELSDDKKEILGKVNSTNKRLRQQDFSFAKAKKITEKLESSLSEAIINERALEQ